MFFAKYQALVMMINQNIVKDESKAVRSPVLPTFNKEN